MPTNNQQFFDAMLRHYTMMNRVPQSLFKELLVFLEENKQRIIAELNKPKYQLRESEPLSSKEKKLKALLDMINIIRMETWDKEITPNFRDSMVNFAASEAAFVGETFAAGLPIVVNLPSRQLLTQLVSTVNYQGNTLKEWFAKQRDSDIGIIQKAVRNGMLEGKPAAQITQELFNAKDSPLSMTRRGLMMLVRTSVMQVSNQANRAFVEENKDIIKKLRVVATLDSRTTITCRARDGLILDASKAEYAPYHWGCRTRLIPVMDAELIGSRPFNNSSKKLLRKEWEELKANKENPAGGFDKWARNKIRQQIGTTPAETTQEEWLKKGHSIEFLAEALGGVKRAKLFKEGLPISELVDENYKPLTLEQLYNKSRYYFNKANITP